MALTAGESGGVAVGVLAALGLVAFFVWYFKFRDPNTNAPAAIVSGEEGTSFDEDGTTLPVGGNQSVSGGGSDGTSLPVPVPPTDANPTNLPNDGGSYETVENQ